MKKLMLSVLASFAWIGLVQAATTWTANVSFGQEYSGYTVWAVNFWNSDRQRIDPSTDLTAPTVGYGTDSKNGKDYAALLNANTSNPDSQIATLNSAKTGDYALLVNAYRQTFSVVNENGISTYNGVDNNVMYSWLFVLVDDLDDQGKATMGTKYAVIKAFEQSPQVTAGPTYHPDEATKAGGYTLTIGAGDVLAKGIVGVPEPTSGLLLLLGLAGLAIRRKRV